MSLPLSRRAWLAGTAAWPLASVAGAAGAAPDPAPRLFGSTVALRVAEGTNPRLLALVWQGLWSVHRHWNAWKPGELAQLNRAFSEGRPIRPSRELAAVLQGAAALERLSGGFFNAAIGGLVGSWGFHADWLRNGTAPAADVLRRWLSSAPSLQALQWREGRVHSPNPLLRVDLGAYAKGVAIDWALDRLQWAGVGHALLDLGGNLATTGEADGGRRPWRVGIRDPFGPGLLAQLPTRGREAVVTSGNYERFRLAGGRRVGHVIDPQRGQPVEALASVTVVHPSAALADAASTALLVAGPERWPAVAQRMGLEQVLVVDAQGRRRATPALARRLQFELG